jgi:hypothetical protein
MYPVWMLKEAIKFLNDIKIPIKMKIRQYRDQFIKTYRQFMEGEAGFST